MTSDMRTNARLFYARWKLPMNAVAVLAALACTWLCRRLMLVSEMLERAHLAPIPREADSTYVSERVGVIVTEVRIGFTAPPDVVRTWWDASPGARGSHTRTLAIVKGQQTSVPARPITTIPPDHHTVFQLPNSPDNDGAQVAITPEGSVDITVFTMPRAHH
jgi:hypothetical protein